MQEEYHSIDEKKAEEKGDCNVKGSGLNLVEENKTDIDINHDGGGEKRSSKRKGERKALREASPACEYERIRAANIAERMELLRALDIEGAVAGAKEGLI